LLALQPLPTIPEGPISFIGRRIERVADGYLALAMQELNMAWNRPGKKGDDSGKRDPWKGRDPDRETDSFIDRLKQSMGGVFGGDGNESGGPKIALWLGVALAVWIVFSCVQLIDETQRGVVLRFGQFSRVMTPGPNIKWPWPIESVTKVETTTVRSASDQVRMLTNDENIVLVDFGVQYVVADPRLFLFGDRDPENTLKLAAEGAIREVIGNSKMDDMLVGTTDLAARARKRLQVSLDDYRTGLSVTEFNLSKVRPPQEVKDAFDDATKAMQDKQKSVNEAQAYASQIVPVARGDAARVRTEAEGYKAAISTRATGDAQRFSLIAEQYRKAPEVTRKRLYLDTMQEVLSASPKIVVGKGSNVFDLPIDRSAPASANAATPSASSAAVPTMPIITATQPARESRPDADARPDRTPRADGREGSDR
jgi:membrane protease subunit HflK